MKKNIKRIFSLLVVIAMAVTIVACGTKSYIEEAISKIDEQLTDAGFEHGEKLEIVAEYKKVKISWESTDPIIKLDGTVNAIGLKADVKVTINVTFKEGDKEELRNYQVTVYHIEDDPGADPDPELNEDQEKIKFVKDSLLLPARVKEDIQLITSSSSVTISWNSNNAAITNAGVVTRSETADVTVTLTATLTCGEESDTKTFTVVVEKIEVLKEAKEALNIELTYSSETITLPTEIGKEYVVNVEWTSSDEAVINVETGVITASIVENKTVTLTAKLTYGAAEETKQFVVTVLKDGTLDNVIEELLIADIVTNDLDLKQTINGVTITWVSSNSSVISDNLTTLGKVVRGNEDVAVTLTATLNYKGHEETKVFELTVKKAATNKVSPVAGWVSKGAGHFSYASKAGEAGYSGQLRVFFEATGYETVIDVQTSERGDYFIGEAALAKLVSGVTYNVRVQAIGDQINYLDSDITNQGTYVVTWPNLDKAKNLVITGNILSWDVVENALTYDIYVTKDNGARELYRTLSATDILAVELPTEVGRYKIAIVASAPRYVSSEEKIDHVVISSDLEKLTKPAISIEAGVLIISEVEHADYYIITIGSIERKIFANQFDLSTLELTEGTYQVTVVAYGDELYYEKSDTSEMVTYDPAIENEKAVIKNAIDAIVIPAHVKENLTLPIELNGVTIRWESSDETIITDAGVVTRSTEENLAVTLTAFFTYGSQSSEKAYSLIVDRFDVLKDAYDLLSIELEVEDNIDLPSSILIAGYNVEITWSSFDADVITDEGIITRSLTDDKSTFIEATLKYNDDEITKEFLIVVLQDMTLINAKDSIVINGPVTDNLELVTAIGGVVVAWQSSNEMVIATDGTVNRPLNEDETVTLTATLTYQGETEIKEFSLLVKKLIVEKLPAPVGFVFQTPDSPFFAYAAYSHVAYSGQMRAQFTAAGHEPLVLVNPSTGGRFEFSAEMLNQLTRGVLYTVIFQAISNSEAFDDSEWSGPVTFTLPKLTLANVTGMEINGNVLTWNAVNKAEKYEIYYTKGSDAKQHLGTVLATEELTIELPTDTGNYKIEIVATADGYNDSTAMINYVVQADVTEPLAAPVISIDGDVLTITAVDNAIGYEIIAGDVTKNISVLTYDLTLLFLPEGTHSIHVIAKGDQVNYVDSIASNVVSYEAATPLTKLNPITRGDFAGTPEVGHGNGHYNFVPHTGHAVYNQEGFSRTLRFEVIVPGEGTRSQTYSLGEIWLLKPTPEQWLLSGLDDGQYEMHVILVATPGSGFADSDPLVLTVSFPSN